MTRELSTTLEAFVGRLRQRHPTLDISCDVPDDPAGSTWVDIRSAADWVVVEYRPELGFGFSDSLNDDDTHYGTPSCRFVRTSDEALAQLDLTLRGFVEPSARREA